MVEAPPVKLPASGCHAAASKLRRSPSEEPKQARCDCLHLRQVARSRAAAPSPKQTRLIGALSSAVKPIPEPQQEAADLIAAQSRSG